MYFELDNCQLNEISTKVFDHEIRCLDIAQIPEGRQRSRFLALGLSDCSVRIISLDSENCLSRISNAAMTHEPSAIALLDFKDESTGCIYLHVGLSNGQLTRSAVDSVTGQILDPRHKQLGTLPVTFAKLVLQDQEAVLAITSRSWLCYKHLGHY